MIDDAENPKRGLSRRATLGTLGGLAAGLAVGATVAHAQDATPAVTVPTPDASLAFKVVLHVADQIGWTAALSNLIHLTTTYSKAEVLVVVDGTGIYVLQGKNDLTTKMAIVAAAGARFQVCAAALAEHQIDPSTMPTFFELVAGGVVALVEAQTAGFAYIRP